MNNKLNIPKNKGAAMITVVLFFMFISLTILIGIVTPVVREFKVASDNYSSKKAYFIAESGAEDAYYRVIKNRNLSASTSLTIGGDVTNTTIVNIGSSQKRVDSIGDSKNNKRKVSLILGTGDGVTFRYGTQAGQGGIYFKNNSFLNGNLYSNGNITGSNGAYITGDAIVAGATGTISNMKVGYNGTSTGSAYAHTITNTTATANIYCQTGSGNNKACDTSRVDPPPLDLPIRNENIDSWKSDAAAGGVINGNQTISVPTTLGLKKIVGNLVVNSSLTLTNTLWVTGNITINSTVSLSPTYGSSSGIMIADGIITTSNGVTFNNSGTAGSYIMLLSTSVCDEDMSTSPCNGQNAISIRNNSNIIIVNAQNGTVSFSNNATVKEAVGKLIKLQNNVGVTYGSGISNADFLSGPSGSWTLSDWKESE